MKIFDFIFGSKEQKPVATGFNFGGISATYGFDVKYAFESYEKNPYLQMVINKKMNDTGANGYEIARELSNGKYTKAVDPTEFERLLSVSLKYTSRQFFKRITRDKQIAGNAYVYMSLNGNSIEAIQVLDPRYIKPVATPTGQIIGYVQELNGIRYFTADEIIHIRDDNDLTNEVFGKSKISSLYYDLAMDKEARESNLAFFLNNQTPASFIILKDTFTSTGSDDEKKLLKDLKDQLEGGKYQGGKNKHRGSVTQIVEKVIPIQDKIDDMQFIEARKFTLDMVCGVYGVPKDIIGFTETSNRSVGDTQAQNYWENIEADEKEIAQALSPIVEKIYGPGYKLRFLKDNLRQLIVRSEIAGSIYEKGLVTRNEAREMIQYPSVEGQDEFKKDIAKDENTVTSKVGTPKNSI